MCRTNRKTLGLLLTAPALILAGCTDGSASGVLQVVMAVAVLMGLALVLLMVLGRVVVRRGSRDSGLNEFSKGASADGDSGEKS